MKKSLIAIIMAIICLTTAVGCGKTPNSSYQGTHWLEQPTFRDVQPGFYEKIEYDVTSELAPEKAPALYPTPGESLVFQIEDGSTFTAELYEENGLYVYKTALKISGTYTYKEKTATVTDDFINTETHFKSLDDGFAPVKTKREVKNTVPKDVSLNEVITFAYDSSIDYSTNQAVVKVTPKDKVSQSYLTSIKDSVTVKKYNKKTYVDNDLMALMLRNFKYDNTLNFTFSSIEDITGSLKQINAKVYFPSATATESSSSQAAIRPMTIPNCSLPNGGRNLDIEFDVFGVKFSTTGEFAQDFLYAYYANLIKYDANKEYSSRHYMVKCYRPAIFNSAYIVYTLSSVTYERD